MTTFVSDVNDILLLFLAFVYSNSPDIYFLLTIATTTATATTMCFNSERIIPRIVCYPVFPIKACVWLCVIVLKGIEWKRKKLLLFRSFIAGKFTKSSVDAKITPAARNSQ